MKIYAQEMEYINPPRENKSPKTFRQRINQTLRVVSLAEKEPRAMIITQIQPTRKWTKVWDNLRSTWAPESIKSTWYKLMHDILSTNERLRAINLSDTAQCKACGNHDTILHRNTDCGTGIVIWEWTRRRVASVLRMNPPHIPKDCIVRPQFDI
jgi:hypothetical protein